MFLCGYNALSNNDKKEALPEGKEPQEKNIVNNDKTTEFIKRIIVSEQQYEITKYIEYVEKSDAIKLNREQFNLSDEDERFFEFIKTLECSGLSENEILLIRKIDDNRKTMGFGHAEALSNPNYVVGEYITREQAIEFLEKDREKAYEAVDMLVAEYPSLQLRKHQINALASFFYNTGSSDPYKIKDFLDAYVDNDIQKMWDSIKFYITSSSNPDSQGIMIRQLSKGLVKRRIAELRVVSCSRSRSTKGSVWYQL